jgi:hypothetical protein
MRAIGETPDAPRAAVQPASEDNRSQTKTISDTALGPQLEPVSRSALESLLRRDSRGRLIRRESSSLEVKQAFNWANRGLYSKSIAAFANARGGHIVFGIKDRPHELVGMKGKSFEDLDDAVITQFLNEYLSPEVRIERRTFELDGCLLGVVWVPEARQKPVVCTKNSGSDLKEGNIYYRYRATSRRIRYPELRALIDFEARRLHDGLLEMVLRIGRIGAANAVVLDTAAGELHTSGQVIVDEDLLKRVKFILEGHFDEVEGDPTLKVIGEAVPAQVVTLSKAVALRTPQLLAAFFGHGLLENATPRDALEQLPYEGSSYMPAFFFVREAGISNEEAATLIEASKATGATKARVASHLRGGVACGEKGTIRRGASPQAGKRADFYDALNSGRLMPDQVSDGDLKTALEAMTHLTREQVEERQQEIIATLGSWYERTRDNSLRQYYGFALCHVDEVLFR